MDVQAMLVAATVTQNNGSSGIGSFLPLIIIVVLVFFFMSTQRRRQRAHQETLASLLPGTLVVTTAGLYATVVEVDGGDVLLEVAPDVVCRFARTAITRVVSVPDDGTQPGDVIYRRMDHHLTAGDAGGDGPGAAAPHIDLTKSGEASGGKASPGPDRPDGPDSAGGPADAAPPPPSASS
jgi:preprotein translocase subunit YajC